MAEGTFMGKLNSICKDKNIEGFLIFSLEKISKKPWCADGVPHSPKFCDGKCINFIWLVPILEEFQKNLPHHAKKNFLTLKCLRDRITAQKDRDRFI